MLTHKTSLHPKLFDIVFESLNKNDDVNKTNIVAFDESMGWCSVMKIEFCKTDEIADIFIIGRYLMDTFSLLDFILHDESRGVWYNIKKGSLGYKVSSYN